MKPVVHNAFVTGHCNLACSFCFSARIREGVPDNPDAVLSEIIRVGAPTVRLCGGEPLTEFERVQAWVQQLPDRQIVVNTNGALLTHAVADWANDSGVTIQLSVDGYAQGERPLTALNLEPIKRVKRLWVNQILFHPEDAEPIEKALLPSRHEVGLLYGQRAIEPEALAAIKNAATGRFLARIDPGSYNEVTTHHNGKTYHSNLNAETDHCVRTRDLIGEAAWITLRNRC
ncbi:radical SAM protein [Ferrimonas balearica]|uniref:radical SAM protein n=1 Tax=Ferrimonas balearica TaxID=44012 RepID=UPI001C9383F2|nr:radical SAM protein [Ferrimonas balearica]